MRRAAAPALLLALSTLWVADSRCMEFHRKSYRPHNLGFATALYHIRFIDEIISPVVYTSSSPLFELFYRNINDVRRHTVFLAFAFYTTGLRDADANDNFEIFDSEGNVYVFPRSLHHLDGSHFELKYEYLGRIFTFEKGNSSFHLGGSIGFYAEEISNIDHWSKYKRRITKTWIADCSLALEGKLERRLRKYDRLSFDLDFTVLSFVSRAPYYNPFGSRENVDPSLFKYSWMSPVDFLRWSAQISYELWLHESFGLEAYYRFQHQRVNEPRDLSYLSHTLSLGVMCGIKASK